MPRPKKGERTPGSGRKTGTPNKDTAELREMILEALSLSRGKGNSKGGVAYLTKQAEEKPAAFLTLLGKVLPMQVQGTGKDGSLEITVKFVDPK